jgi:hypothetical protein
LVSMTWSMGIRRWRFTGFASRLMLDVLEGKTSVGPFFASG